MAKKIIGICNQKGGVGKTTTAINMSAGLAMAGFKVLLIDVDAQGNATSGIGLDKKAIEKTVYDAIINNVPLSQVVVNTKVTNLNITPADMHLTGAQIELVTVDKREFVLKNAIAHIANDFDFIFIDCPPSLGLLTINTLTAADAVLIPLQCEYYALEGLTQLMDTIKLVKQNLNPALDIEGVVLTMADYRTRLTQEVVNEVKSFFKDKVYNTIIPRSIRLSEAPGFGLPIAMYNPHCNGAQKYAELVKEFLSRNPMQDAASVNNNRIANIEQINNIEPQENLNIIPEIIQAPQAPETEQEVSKQINLPLETEVGPQGIN